MNILVSMNILNQIIILFNMTYEEYKKEENKNNKNSFIKKLIGKLFTVVIFTMLVVIASNYSPKFRTFLTDKVLNNSMNFSKVNNILDKFTSMYKVEKTKEVSNVIELNKEKYLDGVKYIVTDNEKVYVKDSGIITYIGEKKGYGNTVVIQQSNGYYAWYGNIKESVKLYDYLESGSEVGVASKEYYYVLLKDDKPIDINEY